MSVTSIGTTGRVPVHVESYKDKFLRRFKEEPLVPIGTLATTVALVMAFTKMRGGNQKSFNNWLRFRVVAQGFTVAAIVGGTYFYGHSKQQKEDRAAEEAARLAAEREQEKLEFEQRLKAAEETHAMETAVQVGKSVVAGLGESSVINATPTTTPLSSESSSSSSSSGWFGWFGGRSAKKD